MFRLASQLKKTGRFWPCAALAILISAPMRAEGNSATYALWARSSASDIYACDRDTEYRPGLCYRWSVDADDSCDVWLFALEGDGSCEPLIDPSSRAAAYPRDGKWFVPDTTVTFVLILSSDGQPGLARAVGTRDAGAMRAEIKKLLASDSPTRKTPGEAVAVNGSWRGDEYGAGPECAEFSGVYTDVYEIRR